VLEVDLTTADDLTDEEEKSIVADIEKATGRRIEATRHVDPALIGGMVIQVGSLRLDGSVRGRLDKLREELLVRG
jgi:F-type H+-transporting ATPase subunit delta